ncbi:factor-independent urate hydroxylase [Pseudokineococcus sp. 1T1Z-3]|uniref:factor-independent urate hydroxylase n=1 Tax=Pseudokineococcus sp. 1T1Z-3 TaxID=3132745 RepID=UPI0030B5FCE7
MSAPSTGSSGAVLAGHQYGKAENRVVRVVRDTSRHEIRDLTVSTTLRGDFEAAYLDGDQTKVLPTDTQKNTVYAQALQLARGPVEEYALGLARHFVDDVAPVSGARVEVEEHTWVRAATTAGEHDHTFERGPATSRVSVATVETGEDGSAAAVVVGGLKDMVLLKTTGSAFKDFLVDELTTLTPTEDRIMATKLQARWRFDPACAAVGLDGQPYDWDGAHTAARSAMVEQFATLESLALQQTLWHMATAVLDAVPGIVEVRLSAPNLHHFAYDLARFGLETTNEVFHADDRPYGHIHATVERSGAPSAGAAWDAGTGLV